MEYASFLAGERWSDHPKCTHPLLAGVARGVNDHISDRGRARLVDHIPAVIGLNGDDPRVDAGIALRCAATALAVVAEGRQRALATGTMVIRRVWEDMNQGDLPAIDVTELFAQVDDAMNRVPHAAGWAKDFTAGVRPSVRAIRAHSAPTMAHIAIVGIAEACIPDPDGLLYDLLTTVLEDCTDWLGQDSSIQSATQRSLTA